MSRLLLTLVVVIAGTLAATDGPAKQVEWLYYGGDPGGAKYSALTDIDQANVGRLSVAWQWKHWETPLEQYKTSPGFFESTSRKQVSLSR